ncbi:LPXTG cell wall anchor domain-containing protein [Plantibacter sp. YIM 135347]|uniref:LPXTG cell wall anchor domain-containing protein n=1 Tax=Plantibacter sp. YIM 135347 TaxID=3423919 RepID=UPI003D3261D3
MKTTGRIAALTGGLALVAASTLALGTPAFAEDFQVSGDDIHDSETPYQGWHQGYGVPGAPAVVTDAGLELTGPSQIINGLDAPLAIDGTTTTFATIVDTLGFESTDDLAIYQLPIYAETGEPLSFTTLRPAGLGQGALSGNWTLSQSVAGLEANTEYTITDISTALGSFDIIAFGVLTRLGDTDTVQTVTFNGDTYRFNTVAAPAVPTVTVLPESITLTDVKTAGKGFSVEATGFTEGESLTIAITSPDGTVFGTESGENTVVADETGGFLAENVVLVGDGIGVGVYTFTVTAESDATASDTFTVTADAVPAVAPAKPTINRLPDTGANTTPLLAGGAAFLTLGALAMAIAAKRRQQA